MTSIGIFGRQGRMGHAIEREIERIGEGFAGGTDQGDDPAALAAKADVLVDFSSPLALEANLAAARAHATPILIGTTGLSDRHQAMIDAAAQDIAVLQTGNTSLGIALLSRLVRDAARRLGPDWDIEIVESHHRLKVDAPSGTALMLGDAAAEGLGTTLADSGVIGRAGLVGARAGGTIGFASLRGGTVIGDHQVVFAGEGERIELSHRADDRALFARGAVRAAQWLTQAPVGRHGMDAVVGV
ncbi:MULTISPECIES: 4-hydroxy-tetrahydrodipicolinate reductase [unclassified Sphingomonas]|uniref:4-hydroxy-tetrahydrodipicolinate reductase n=1 Tax=unclassified Sphingomonas TaxID=196159 RepID=UPI0007003DE2|nr:MULTISPECIES: 4-hydroxy-tetrahydrodipicolinate reductase [unclassified Sphingomonas]KQN07611.1 4-hydroxy-tetrahydrodipicolinate reductase [Sphingomonas sp. Leaf25]KQN35529.1 4-hydroxy-tetrahydrodipicolinate reductase [Sphingomonas sp. Leaf42]KQT26396.1 4-hydroxy-tetrahydrodipicolinate reductase [Sphingomonas sp. Leaf407]